MGRVLLASVLIEWPGKRGVPFGDQPDVAPETLGHHVDAAASLDRQPPGVFARPGKALIEEREWFLVHRARERYFRSDHLGMG